MSKISLACGLALALAVASYAPEALAQKVTRDPTVPTTPVLKPRPAPAAEPAPDLPKLSAAQIVEKNEAARGGVAAWRAVDTITFTGKIDAGGKQDTLLPIKIQIKRPNKQRITIDFAGHTAVQVFDGQHGWKLRPYLNRPDAEPFSADELQKALAAPPLEGQLIDYAAKGSKVELEGTEMVEKRPTYRLKVTTKQGHTQHFWIDGSTFLEAKAEADPHRFNSKMRKTETYYRDYHRVGGISIPYVAETRVESAPQGHALTFEKAVVNEAMDDSLFAKPAALTAAEMPVPPKMVKVSPTTAPAAPTGSTH
jgi:outer membrane lipoprotein-sorting protein